jgi:uncharacterized protein YkwD
MIVLLQGGKCMTLMNKFILTVALISVCSVSAEAQNRRYRSNNGYSNRTYSNNTYANNVRVAPQQQTVYKPVVTATAPVTTSPVTTRPIVTVSNNVSKSPVAVQPAAFGGIEAEIISQTNAQRARYGLPPLSVCPNLMSSARQHCSWMARANSMTHTSAPVAENIAAGQQSATDALNSWMNSSGHRANILGRGYTMIGVAAVTASNGQTYWCQQFR